MKFYDQNKFIIWGSFLLIVIFFLLTPRASNSLITQQDSSSLKNNFKNHDNDGPATSVIAATLNNHTANQFQALSYAPAPLNALSPQEELDFPQAHIVESCEIPGPCPHQKQRLRILKTDLRTPYIRTEEVLDTESGALLGRLEMIADQLLVVLPKDKEPQQFLKDTSSEVMFITPVNKSLSIYQVNLRNASLASLPEALKKIQQDHGTGSLAEPNYIGHLSQRANNCGYPYQWALWKNSEENLNPHFRHRYTNHFYKSAHGESDYLKISSPRDENEDDEPWAITPGGEYTLPIDIFPGFPFPGYMEPSYYSTVRGINAEEGWNLRTSAISQIVGIIDSGIRISHENLKDNIWVNPHMDTKMNDLHGYNAQDNNGNISDDLGHGTHCAGIIGATASAESNKHHVGVAGVAWNIQLMPCKCADSHGTIIEDALIRAIDYAKEHGAMILNCSLGWIGSSQSIAMSVELNDLRKKGIILVASAGNDAINNDSSPFKTYPASYSTQLDNIVSVAATDYVDNNQDHSNAPYEQEGLASFSNYGENTVSLAAPGTFILSTSNQSDQSYVFMSGTSMAAPYVTGTLALMREEFPHATYRELINHLIKTTDSLPSLNRKVASGRLNVAKALSTPPTPLDSSQENIRLLNTTLMPSECNQTYKLLRGPCKRNDPLDKLL